MYYQYSAVSGYKYANCASAFAADATLFIWWVSAKHTSASCMIHRQGSRYQHDCYQCAFFDMLTWYVHDFDKMRARDLIHHIPRLTDWGSWGKQSSFAGMACFLSTWKQCLSEFEHRFNVMHVGMILISFKPPPDIPQKPAGTSIRHSFSKKWSMHETCPSKSSNLLRRYHHEPWMIQRADLWKNSCIGVSQNYSNSVALCNNHSSNLSGKPLYFLPSDVSMEAGGIMRLVWVISRFAVWWFATNWLIQSRPSLLHKV